MKKLKITIITATIFFLSILFHEGFAQNAEKTSNNSKSPQNTPVKKPRGFLEIHGGIGATYPYGKISGDGGQKEHISESTSTGFNAGYILGNNDIITLGVAYVKQTVEFERNYMNKLMLTSIKAKYLTIEPAYRLQYNSFYLGLGFYYAFPMGIWSRKNALNGEVTENLLYGDNLSQCKTTAGISLLGGFTFNINENSSINLGLKILAPVIPAYEYGQDSIKILNLSISASISQKISLPFNISFLD